MLNLHLNLLFAQVIPDKLEEIKAVKGSSPKILGTDVTIILAVGLGLAAILFFWAFFLRRRPQYARGSIVVERADKAGHSSSGRRRRRRRGDHPSNWGRNPTLSETGGLPPPRPDEPEPPAPAPQATNPPTPNSPTR